MYIKKYWILVLLVISFISINCYSYFDFLPVKDVRDNKNQVEWSVISNPQARVEVQRIGKAKYQPQMKRAPASVPEKFDYNSGEFKKPPYSSLGSEW